MKWPERIVCLTQETTETLYLLGQEHRIVGISGFTVRPARARKEKPEVSAFTSAKIDKILALESDLVLGFSDLQADITRELISGIRWVSELIDELGEGNAQASPGLFQASNTSRTSRYLSAVFFKTLSEIAGPGAVLFQSSVSR